MFKLFYRPTILLFTLLSLLGPALQANPYQTHQYLAKVSQGLVQFLAVQPKGWNSQVIQNLQNALYYPSTMTGLIVDFARIHVGEAPAQTRHVHIDLPADSNEDQDEFISEWASHCNRVERALASMWRTLALLRSYYEAHEADQKFADDIRNSFGDEMDENHPYYNFRYTHYVETWGYENQWPTRGQDIPRALIDCLRRDLGEALRALEPLLVDELGIHLRTEVRSGNGMRTMFLNAEVAMPALANYFLGNLGIADTHFEIAAGIEIEGVLQNLLADLDELVPPSQTYNIDIDVEEDLTEEDADTGSLTSSLDSLQLDSENTHTVLLEDRVEDEEMDVKEEEMELAPAPSVYGQVQYQQVVTYGNYGAQYWQVNPEYYYQPQMHYYQPVQAPYIPTREELEIQRLQQIWRDNNHLQHPQPVRQLDARTLFLGLNPVGACF